VKSFGLPESSDAKNLTLGALILVAATAAMLAPSLGIGTAKDLGVYLLAAQRFADGASVYGPHFGQALPEPLPYTYPPVLAAGLSLVAWVPRNWAVAVWTALDLALLIWVVNISFAPFLERLGRRRPVALAILVGVFGLTAPVMSVFDLGQVGIVLLALVLADTINDRTRLPRGVLVGVATAIKLLPSLFILYWVVIGRRRAAVVAIASAVGLWCLAAIMRPDVSQTYWLHVVTDPDRPGDASVVVNQSINGALQRLGWETPVVWAALAVVATAVGLHRARLAHRAGDELAAVSLVALATLLASPVSWIHHAVWIVPAAGVLLGDGTERRRRLAWVAMVVLFLSDAPVLPRAGLWIGGPAAVVLENAFVAAYVVLLFLLPISGRREERSPEMPSASRDLQVVTTSMAVRAR